MTRSPIFVFMIVQLRNKKAEHGWQQQVNISLFPIMCARFQNRNFAITAIVVLMQLWQFHLLSTISNSCVPVPSQDFRTTLDHTKLTRGFDSPTIQEEKAISPVSVALEDNPFPLPICSRNGYLTAIEDNAATIASRMDHWLSDVHLNSMRHEAQTNKTLLLDWNRFDFALAPLAKCRPNQRVCVGGACGHEQSKIACGVEMTNPNCIVYSLGSNNLWGFEEDLLKRTACEIHTFDCTGPLERFNMTPDRVHFHHVCLGTVFEPAPDPAKCGNIDTKCGETWTLQQMQSKLGHDRIDLLKVDIEGYEWPLLQSWWDEFQAGFFSSEASASNTISLPHQIMMEVHFQMYFADQSTPEAQPPCIFSGKAASHGIYRP
jgi:Methyltransferase domain